MIVLGYNNERHAGHNNIHARKYQFLTVFAPKHCYFAAKLVLTLQSWADENNEVCVVKGDGHGTRTGAKLLPGFLAIAVFMTGDGFELTFLSKYVVDQGFSSSQASLLFTMYGLVAALAGWSSGVLAELFGAKRIMLIGAGSWIVLHLVFIGVALPSHSYPLMLASYMLRGMGYPLFIYSFVVLLAQTVDPGKLASAMGWFWTSYSFGIGVFGAYLPAFITPVIGEYYSLWVSLPFSIVGMIICLCFCAENP